MRKTWNPINTFKEFEETNHLPEFGGKGIGCDSEAKLGKNAK